MQKPAENHVQHEEPTATNQLIFVSSAVDSPTATVLVILGEGVFEQFQLSPGQELVLGRGADADLRVDGKALSRRHVRLRTGPPVSIEDLGSHNGTLIGNRRLAPGERVDLAPGEVVLAGGLTLVVTHPGAEAGPAREDLTPREPARGGDSDRGGAPGEAVICAPAMVELYQLVDRIAASPISVLLLGETGVGKEVMAEAIHRRSPRASKPFLRLNCAALSETLLESELFGHEKGAFTGAVAAKQGLLETAHEGTLFLDEVGELPMSIQVKLLRVLEERCVTRVGGLKPRAIDVRVIAATNRDLEMEIERSTFRRDLYFRLNGISLTIPPLRERLPEIERLARTFLSLMSHRLGRATPRLSDEAVARLMSHSWPGNVRELRNTIERAAVLCTGEVVTPEHLFLERPSSQLTAPPSARSATLAAMMPPVPEPPRSSPEAAVAPASGEAASEESIEASMARLRGDLEAAEKRRIVEALERCGGNQTQAARLLGISRGTLVARIALYGLPRPRGRKSTEPEE